MGFVTNAVKGIGNILSGGPAPPQLPPPPPPINYPQTDAAAAAAQKQGAARAGFASTVATSPQGVSSQAQTAFKSLIGG